MKKTFQPRKPEWSTRRNAEGLRTRYRPECRINHAFFSVVPWLDTLLLAVAVIIALGSRLVVPGTGVELPDSVFNDGISTDLVLVVNSLPEEASLPGSEFSSLVFFNDDRFNLSDERQAERLQESVAAHMERVGGRDALLYIDRRVPHGDIVKLNGLLRQTGVRRASLATQTP